MSQLGIQRLLQQLVPWEPLSVTVVPPLLGDLLSGTLAAGLLQWLSLS